MLQLSDAGARKAFTRSTWFSASQNGRCSPCSRADEVTPTALGGAVQSRLPSNPLQLPGVLLELGKIITSPSEMPNKYALIGFSVDHNIDLNWKIAYASLCIEAKHIWMKRSHLQLPTGE